MTVTSPSDGPAERQVASGTTGSDVPAAGSATPPIRRRASVLSKVDGRSAVRPPQHAHQPSRPAGWARGPGSEHGRTPHPAVPDRSATFPSKGSTEGGQAVTQDDRWSREWFTARRRQRATRLVVALGLAAAAGITVLALV